MSTPNGTSTPYASVTDLMNYRDWRTLADWISINDARGTQSAFETNPIVATHLLMNSGEVESACFRGGRYQLADLQALTGAAQQLLVRLVCWLTIASLARFKTRTKDPAPEGEWAEKTLEALRNGNAVFSLQEVSNDAFMAEASEAYPRHQRPSWEAERMFGQRGCHDRG
jgi:hypothetical protein